MGLVKTNFYKVRSMRERQLGIIIEARTGSSRFPNKVLKKIGKRTLIEFIIDRLKKIKRKNKIILATTKKNEDLALIKIAKKNQIDFFRGSENNVYKRVLDAAKKFKIDDILEICGDCPLLDTNIMEKQIETYYKKKFDYVGSDLNKTFPLGVEGKIFSTKVLEKCKKFNLTRADKENVSLFIYEHPKIFNIHIYKARKKLNRPDISLVVDYPEDLKIVKLIDKKLNRKVYDTLDVISFLDKNNNLKKKLASLKRVKVAGRDE